MSKDSKPKIKPVSRDKSEGKGINALRECSCFDEVDRRVRLGWSASEIAKMIRDEYGELNEFSFIHVKNLVDEHRRQIPPQELALTTNNSHVSRNAVKKLHNGINELEELQRLYNIQKKRIDIDFENEKNINKLLPNTNKEVFVAMKLLKQSADLKMDLGLAKRQLGEVGVNHTPAEVTKEYGSESVGKVITDPDSRNKVLGMVKMLMSAAQRADIDAAHIVSKDEEVIDAEYSVGGSSDDSAENSDEQESGEE